MSLFTSILKDIAEGTIPKTSAVPKRFNKPWFSDICKACNRVLERFKREPTEGNLNAYRIARAKARRDIRHDKNTSWRNYVSKMNSKHRSNLCGIGSEKSRERNPIILYIIYLSMIEMSHLIVTLHWQIMFLLIRPLLWVHMLLHLYAVKLKSRILNLHLKC